MIKLGRLVYKEWKNCDDMFSRFDTVLKCDRRTNGRADRQTELLYINIALRINYVMRRGRIMRSFRDGG